MTPHLLALAMLAQPECHVGRTRALTIATEALRQEVRYDLPRGLLVAVVLAESGGRKIVARRRGKGRRGCDSGEAQIHIPRCDERRLRRLLVLSTNLAEAARLLAQSRQTCQRRSLTPCEISEWALYNAGSRGGWPRVERIWERLQSHRAPQS